MPSFRRRASVIDTDVDSVANDVDVDRMPGNGADPAVEPTDVAIDADDAMALAEQAEAEAAEAEAVAAAARAKARAIRLRRQAQAGSAVAETTAETEADPSEPIPGAVASTDDDAVSDSESVAVVESGSDRDDGADFLDEDVDDDEPRRSTTWRILQVAAAVVAVLATAALSSATAYMVVKHRHAVSDAQQRSEYAAAGRQTVISLMSLDYNDAQANVDRIIDNSTGAFRDDFEGAAQDFIKVAKDSKAVTEVTVNSTAVKSMTADTAEVLVAATSHVTNTSGARDQPRSWRLLVSLQREGDRIKMSKMEFVP